MALARESSNSPALQGTRFLAKDLQRAPGKSCPATSTCEKEKMPEFVHSGIFYMKALEQACMIKHAYSGAFNRAGLSQK